LRLTDEELINAKEEIARLRTEDQDKRQ